jgi:hypothetical protein
MAAGARQRVASVTFCRLIKGNGSLKLRVVPLFYLRVMSDGCALQDCFNSFPSPVAMNIVALAATLPGAR